MKITALRTFLVCPKFLFVKVETDEGLVGYGECLPDKALVQQAVVQSFEHYLLGEDPRKIVHHWQAMVRGSFWRGGPAMYGGISGIEMALWDILGKSLGVPVWQLLGGPVRDRVRVYTHCRGRTPDELAHHARLLVAAGYTGMKFGPVQKFRGIENPRAIDDAVDRVAAVRDAVGDEVDIFLDFHGRVSPPMAIQLEGALRPYRPSFIEEPVLPENAKVLAEVASKFRTPVATGERLFSKWGFRETLELGGVSILQPDPCVAGGILECRQIAAMAETYYANVALHNPYGPINLAACLHLAAAIPNYYCQEFLGPEYLGGGCLKQPFEVVDGHIVIPDGPGLGFELEEDYCLANPMEAQIDHGRWFHDDGSVGDW